MLNELLPILTKKRITSYRKLFYRPLREIRSFIYSILNDDTSIQKTSKTLSGKKIFSPFNFSSARLAKVSSCTTGILVMYGCVGECESEMVG